MTEPTTKDQAIAPLQGLASYLRCEAGGVFAGHPSHGTLLQWAKEVEATQPPAPDCRTCEHLYPVVDNAFGGYKTKCDMNCTNGDQYQPAPKVVLWRTEREIGLAELKANWSGDPPDGGFEKYVELHGQPIEIRDPKP